MHTTFHLALNILRGGACKTKAARTTTYADLSFEALHHLDNLIKQQIRILQHCLQILLLELSFQVLFGIAKRALQLSYTFGCGRRC